MDLFSITGAKTCYTDLLEIKGDVTMCVDGMYSPDKMQSLNTRIKKLDDSLTKLSIQYGPLHPHFPHIRRMMDDLKGYKKNIGVIVAKGKIRRAPVSFQINGPPGIGKSNVLMLLLKQALHITGIDEYELSDIAFVKEGDKFDSNITNATKAIVIDDIGAVRQDALKTTLPLVHKIIEFSNAIPSPALKAEVDEKGKIYPNHTVLGITSNKEHMFVNGVFTTAQAIYRRVPILIEVLVPTEFSSGGTIDLNKVQASGRPLVDIIQFQIFRRYEKDGHPSKQICHYNCDELDVCGGPKTIGLHDLLSCFNKMASDDWNRSINYQKVIDRVISLEFCGNCGIVMHGDICPCSVVLIEEEYEPTMIMNDIPLGFFNYCVSLLLWPVYNLIALYRVTKFKWELARRGLQLMEGIDFYGEAVKQIDDKVQRRISSFRNEYKGLVRICGIGILVFSSYKFIKYMTKRSEEMTPTVKITLEGQDLDLVLPPENERPFYIPDSSKIGERQDVISKVYEGLAKSSSNTTESKLLSIMNNNCYLLCIGSKCVNGFFVSGQIFVTVAHVFPKEFLENLDSSEVLGCKLINQKVTTSIFSLERKYVRRVNESDMVYILFYQVNPKSDLSRYIRYVKDDGAISLPNAKMFSLKKDGVVSNCISDLYNGKIENISMNMDEKKFHGKGFVFTPASEVGTSGSLVYRVEGQQAFILGIQSAASHFNTSFVQGFDVFDYNDILKSVDSWIPTYNKIPIPPIKLDESPGKYSIYPHLIGNAIDYVGTIPNYIGSKSKSNFRRTNLYPYLTNDGKFKINGVNISKDRYIIPHLSPFTLDKRIWISPKLIGLGQSATTDMSEPSPTLLRVCYEDYMEEIRCLKFPEVHGPLTVDEAINGVPGIKGMNKQAAAGFGHSGVFGDYLIYDTPQVAHLKPEILKEFRRLEADVFYGKAVMQIMKANVKDEIIKEKKQLSPRIFMSSPMLFMLLCKVWLMPILNFFLIFPNEFEVCLGINALGKSWTLLYDSLSQRRYVFDGDYEKYDKRQFRSILLLFIRFIEEVCDIVHYPKYGKRMAVHCVEMMIFYFVEVNGDIYMPHRSLASGVLVTIFLNSFVNSILFRIVWFSYFSERFRKMNTLRTFGDDCANGTDEKKFNLFLMRDELKKYGMVFTPANKSLEHLEFTPLSEVTFLKRSFKVVYLKDGERYALCPLDEISILKMLSFTDCKREEESLIILNNIIDAHKQYWFHGKNVFLNRKAFLQKLSFYEGYFNSIGDNKESGNPYFWYTFEELEEEYLNKGLQIQFI